jgi:repressor LexA
VTYKEGAPRTVRVLRPSQKQTSTAEIARVPMPRPAPAEVEEVLSARDQNKIVWVPFVGQIAAGTPIPPLESISDRYPMPREIVGAEEGLFLLRVVGDSMTGVGIFPGDWVVVRQLYDQPKNGDIVAAVLVGFETEGTVKTYMKMNRQIWLMPQNSAYTPIPGDKAAIHGKVVAVLRQI